MTASQSVAAQDEPRASTTTVIVIGAGMSGLVAARELHRRGVDVLVLESADRLGGRVMTVTSALGSRVDLGGQWIGHGHERFAALARELGATQFDMHTQKRPVVIDGERRLSAPGATLLRANLALVRSTSRRPRAWNA